MPKKDIYSSLEDLLSDQSFIRWIYENEGSEIWQNWLSENPYQEPLVAEARAVLIALKEDEDEISESEVSEALENVWFKVEEKASRKSFKLNKSKILKYAAAVLILMSFILLHNKFDVGKSNTAEFTENHMNRDKDGVLRKIENTGLKPKLITLSDGSSILLQPNSKINYPSAFKGNKREVYLSGEAFFEVSKDKKKPFFVYSDALITKVVGTSFRIKAYPESKHIEVIVKSGEVEVGSVKKGETEFNEELNLLPNQVVRFEKEGSQFVKIDDLTTDKLILESKINIEKISFEFEDTPVAHIFKTLEQAYSIEIDFPESELSQCYLTSSLGDHPLPEKLKIICSSISAETQFEINESIIKINSYGCK